MNKSTGLERWQKLSEEIHDELYETREAPQLEAMRAWTKDYNGNTLYGCHEDCAHEAHFALLKFFDEHEPTIADAIRYGVKHVSTQWIRTSTCWQGNGPDGGHTEGCYPKPPEWRVDYPEGVEPLPHE